MSMNENIISSRNNQFVKFAASLSDKKSRDKHGYFIAEGVKLTREAFEAGLPVKFCVISENKYAEFQQSLFPYLAEEKFRECKIVLVTESVFEKITTEKAPQGIISIIKYLDFFYYFDIIYKEEFFLQSNEKAILLYSVRDPSNLGAVIRSAAAFGVDHIVLSDDCADIYNPKTIRSAMGSMYRVKISRVKDISSFISSSIANLRNVYAAEMTENAKNLNDIRLRKSDIVMIGNEGHGIPPEISKKCNDSVYIPISKKTESLNASVAAAIFMWEQSK